MHNYFLKMNARRLKNEENLIHIDARRIKLQTHTGMTLLQLQLSIHMTQTPFFVITTYRQLFFNTGRGIFFKSWDYIMFFINLFCKCYRHNCFQMNVDHNSLTVESPFIVASVIIILSHGKTFIENKPSRLNLYMKTLLFLNIV